MHRIPAFFLLLAISLLGCNNTPAPTPSSEDEVDALLQIQNAVIADVDTFFLSFSDTNYCVTDCYNKLGLTLNNALLSYKDLSDNHYDKELKNASLNVCLTIRDLYQHQFQQMVALDSALNISFSESQQQCFDSLADDCFVKIEQAQNLVK